MNKTYRFHPAEYAVGETEAFYARMAQKGFLLEKRGVYLSRFRKGKPEKRLYRVEFASPSLPGDSGGLQEEQLRLYSESGWEHTASCGLIHVFSAAEDGNAPKIYSDPIRQASIIKTFRRKYLFSWLPPFFLLLLHLIFSASLSGGRNILTQWLFSFQKLWVEQTAGLLAYLFGMGLLLFKSIYAAYRSSALYHCLQRGKPLCRQSRKRHILHWGPQGLLLLLLAVSLAGAAVQWSQTESYSMPAFSDGPYLTLSEMGIDGKRGESPQGGGSRVEAGRSLAAGQWHTFECVESADDQHWLYQDIYSFRTERQAENFVPILMHTAVFAGSPSDFTKIQAGALDEAYISELEILVRKGNTLYFLTSADVSAGRLSPGLLLEAVSEKKEPSPIPRS